MFCAALKKDGGKCGNKAKFGNLCGVHNNSKKASEKKSTPRPKQALNLEKFEKYITKVNNKKKKSFAEKLEKPTRRKSN